MVDAAPCTNRLNGATPDGGGATGALLGRNVRIPFSCDRSDTSTPKTAVGSVDVNPADSSGSLARKLAERTTQRQSLKRTVWESRPPQQGA